jgi:hypothetical protein
VKILINSPLMSDKIINLLSEYKENGVAFTFIKKNGMRLEFEISGIEGQMGCNLVKTLIKSTDFGKVLYFTVEEV